MKREGFRFCQKGEFQFLSGVMIRRVALVLVCIALVAGGAKAARPRFSLAPDQNGGTLSWRSHTFIADGDRLVPKGDFIIDDPKADAISLCLEWKTEPNKQTGDFLAAFGDWPISRSNLKAEAYVVSAERSSANAIVFTLSLPDGRPELKSQSYPVAKGWSGMTKEVAKHIDPVPVSALEEKVPESAPLPTTTTASPVVGGRKLSDKYTSLEGFSKVRRLFRQEDVVDTIANSPEVILYEGLPHVFCEWPLFYSAAQRDDILWFHDIPFYSRPISLAKEDREAVFEFLRAPFPDAGYGPGPHMKLNGGFHADFCAMLKTKNRSVGVMFSFASADMIVFTDQAYWLKEIDEKPGREELKKRLFRYAHFRPLQKPSDPPVEGRFFIVPDAKAPASPLAGAAH